MKIGFSFLVHDFFPTSESEHAVRDRRHALHLAVARRLAALCRHAPRGLVAKNKTLLDGLLTHTERALFSPDDVLVKLLRVGIPRSLGALPHVGVDTGVVDAVHRFVQLWHNLLLRVPALRPRVSVDKQTNLFAALTQ